MKIVFITATMGGGGSERVIAELANQYIAWDYQVEIVMTAGKEIAYYVNPKVKIVQLGEQTRGSLGKRLNRICLLRKLIIDSQEALFISFGTETNLFCVLAGLGIRVKMILSERNNPNCFTHPVLRAAIYSLGCKFVFQTYDAQKYFSPSIQKRSMVIPNPITKQLPAFEVKKRERTIVTVGRLTSEKNHRLLLEAFERFSHKHKDYKLILYGEGELKESLEECAKELQIREKLEFAGFHQDVLDQIKCAAMYVLSSDSEGISNSLLEAMAIGLPVISTDCPIGGSRMCIQNGVNGLLVPVGNVEAMAEAMIQVADCPEWAEKMGQEASKVKERFSVENIARQWLEFGEEK